jgi:hypothetical protein
MSNPFPIVPVSDLFSLIFLIILNFHFWQRTKRVGLPSLRAFTWFFLFFTLLMFVFSLAGLVVKNLLGIQLLLNIGDFLFYVVLILFVHLLCLIAFPENHSLPFVMSVFLAILGLGVFAWEMFFLSSSKPLLVETAIKGLRLVIYRSTAPPVALLITGITGVLAFVVGAWVFLTRARKLTESTLRRRSFFIGLGCVGGIIAVIFNFVFAVFPSFVMLHLGSSISVLFALFLIYKAVLVNFEEGE